MFVSAQQPKLYTKNDLIKKLAQENIAIGLSTLNEQIARLKIDAVFENERKEEIFDNSAYEKISEAILMQDVSLPAINVPKQAPQAPLSVENAFKLDISENTLNMIARSIARKVTKHVGVIYSSDSDKMQKIAMYEEQNQQLNAKLEESEKENQRLRLLLNEANTNLNLYKPTAFGLYKFTGKRRKH